MIDVPIQVKDALREGRLRKNYRFQVLNDDGTVDFTIDNDNLVSESVSIDERMCSGDKIKYGLCEGSSLEFQYFGKENITGRQLKVFVDVEYGESTPYAIPMGYFTVKNCSRQASTGIMKATAYNKLMSDYLDSKANSSIVEIVANGEPGISDGVTYYYLLNKLLEGYAIDNRADDLVQVNISGEDTSRVDNHGGNMNVGTEYAAFRVYKQNNYTSDIRTLGLYIFKRKVATVNTRPEQDAHSSYCSVMIPKEYNRVTFSSNVAKDLRIGFNEVFGEYILESLNDEYYTYYIQPVFSRTHIDWSHIDDSGYFDYAGTAYELNEVLNSQEEIWPITFIGQAYSGYDTHIDSSLKGMVVLDNDNNGGAFSMYPHVELKSPSGSRDFFFKQFITPTNADSSDYFWVELDTSSGGCNCADLILPTEVYYLERGKDYYSLGYEYPWNNNQDYNFGLEIKHKTISDLEKMRILQAQAESFADVTLRELQSAAFEIDCQFGQLDRETDLFSGVELNRSRLLPADTLYPDNALYPNGAQESAFRSQYSKLWADEGNVRKWRYLIITYKGLDENQQEKDFTLQRTVNADGTDDYNMSDNWLFRNLIWTATDIGSYADAMVLKMRDITWFPFEMWCAGLPYLETGDEIEIPLGEDTYTSYILQRQLKGIQNLQDTYINGTLDIF